MLHHTVRHDPSPSPSLSPSSSSSSSCLLTHDHPSSLSDQHPCDGDAPLNIEAETQYGSLSGKQETPERERCIHNDDGIQSAMNDEQEGSDYERKVNDDNSSSDAGISLQIAQSEENSEREERGSDPSWHTNWTDGGLSRRGGVEGEGNGPPCKDVFEGSRLTIETISSSDEDDGSGMEVA